MTVRTRTRTRLGVNPLEDRTAPAAHLTDHSDFESYVITRPEAVNVFIGSAWNTDTKLQGMRQYLNGVVQDMVSSAFMDTMSEYYWDKGFFKEHIGRGSFRTSVTMPVNPGQSVTDIALHNFLAQQIRQGGLPRPNDWQTAYMVFLAPGIRSQTCADNHWAAYHSYYLMETGETDPQTGLDIITNVAYAVMPTASASSFTVGSDGWKQKMTIMTAHELTEVVTNPMNHAPPGPWPGLAWYDDVQKIEIADICEGENLVTGVFHGYTVQAVWSNRAYSQTGDGRLLPAGSTNVYRRGRADGIKSGQRSSLIIGEDEEDLAEPFRPVAATTLVRGATDPGTPVTIPDRLAGVSNPTGAPLAPKSDTPPAHGQVTYSASGNGSLTYTPDPGFVGRDLFTYALTDGTFDSLPVTVVIDVAPAVDPPADLTEQNAVLWTGWADGGVATVTDDPTRTVAGQTSLAFWTTGAFDTSVTYALGFGRWDLTRFDRLHVAFYAENPNVTGFQSGSPWLRLFDVNGDYFEYQYHTGGNPFDLLNEARGGWQTYDVPLGAGADVTDGWRRTTSGAPDLSRIAAVAIHADTWDAGFNLWIDDLGFRSPTPPTISSIPDQEVVSGRAAGPIPFTVGDAESEPADLAVSATSSDQALIPDANIQFGGAGTDRTITVAPVPGQAGTVTITVTVRDPGGLTGIATFTVAVSPAPNTLPNISDIPDQAVTAGRSTGGISFTIADTETPVDELLLAVATSNAALAPLTGIVLGGAGANRTITVTPAAGQTGTAVITVTVTDAGGLTASDTFALTVTDAQPPPTVPPAPPTVPPTTPPTVPPTSPPVPPVVPPTVPPTVPPDVPPSVPPTVPPGVPPTVPPVVPPTSPPPNPIAPPVGPQQFAVGVGSNVQLRDPDRSVRYTVAPLSGSAGEVRTAAADFNRDGVADVVVGTGPGSATRVRVLDGKDQRELFALDPFEASFVGGVYVSAGDVTGDGIADLVITPDEGGGPRVRVFSGAGFGQLLDFFGIDDVNFRGGARAAAGDINSDGTADLIVAAGFQGGPRVAGFDGRTLASGSPIRLFGDFFAFEQTLRNGIFVAAGDIDGDGFADLIAGGGPGGGPRVTAFSGKALLANQQTPIANFFGGDPDNRGGVRVAVKDLDSDNRADLVVGAGSGAGSRVTAYYGKAIAPAGTPPAAFDFDAAPGFTGGVFVG